MSFSRMQKNHTGTQYIPVMANDMVGIREFPSLYPQDMKNHRASFLFKHKHKHNQNVKLDPTCIFEFGILNFSDFNLPCFQSLVSAGYPSGADDSLDTGFDLINYLIRHPKTAYYVRAKGYSMVEAGIFHTDILVIDTAMEAQHGSIVMAVVNGELTIKRFHKEGPELMLLSANPDHPPITITKGTSFFIQGVVTSVIRHFKPHH